MKKKIGILALILALLLCFLTISVFAGEDIGNSQMPFVDSDQITPEHPDIQTEDALMEEFEKMFGDSGGKILIVTLIGTLFMSLFFPALIITIVFGVLNSKTKKKVKEYERFFGSVSQNTPAKYISNVNNAPYTVPPVNPTGVPMGTTPLGNTYISQNDLNKQQGGQFDENQ